MKKTLRNLIAVGTLTLFASPVFAAKYISVNVDNANVRTGPSTNKPVTMELFRGYPLQVLDSKGEWYYVVDFEGDKGWIHEKITVPQNSVIVNAKNSLNMRSNPSTKDAIIAKVDRGVVMEVISRKGKWVNVRHSSGTVGWIYGDLLWP